MKKTITFGCFLTFLAVTTSMGLTAQEKENLTDWIFNPSFELNPVSGNHYPDGWDYTQNSYSWCAVNNDIGASQTVDGGYVFGIWSKAIGDFEIAQEISGLKNGSYRVKCVLMIASDKGAFRLTTQRLFAGNEEDGYTSQLFSSENKYAEEVLGVIRKEGTCSFAGHKETDDAYLYHELSVDATITNGVLKLGIRTEGIDNSKGLTFNDVADNAVGWFKVDNFRLYSLESGTSIKSVNEKPSVKLFTRDNQIVVDFNLLTADNIELTVYNEQGQVVEKEKEGFVAGNNQKIAAANLSSGIYIVKVTSNGQSTILKAIK